MSDPMLGFLRAELRDAETKLAHYDAIGNDAAAWQADKKVRRLRREIAEREKLAVAFPPSGVGAPTPQTQE